MTEHAPASVLYDAQEYLVAGAANHAEWWEHLGDAHRDYAQLARVAVDLASRLQKIEAAAFHLIERYDIGDFTPEDVGAAEAALRDALTTSSEGGGNREHLSSAKAAAVPDPEAYGRDHGFIVHSPHGDWNVVVSMYAIDSLPARTLAGHAKNHLVPISQFRYVWYLTEDGRRLPDDELVRCDRPREFNLCMEMP